MHGCNVPKYTSLFKTKPALRNPQPHLVSYLTLFTNVPIPPISTLMSPPSLNTTLGSLKYPIPAGVPVMKSVPASSVVP